MENLQTSNLPSPCTGSCPLSEYNFRQTSKSPQGMCIKGEVNVFLNIDIIQMVKHKNLRIKKLKEYRNKIETNE